MVIGVVAYVLSEPKKGTLEWHKRELLRATGGSLEHKLKKLWYRIQGKYEVGYYVLIPQPEKRRSDHYKALLNLGYIVEREFALSNRSVDEMRVACGEVLFEDPRWRHVRRELLVVSARGTNVLVVAALPEDLLVISNAILKADVSQSSK